MLRRSSRILAKSAETVKSTAPLGRNFSTDSLVLKHDPEKQEFYVQLDNEKAIVTYELINNKDMHFMETEVPKAFQGKGIGKFLAKGVFDYAVEKDLSMKISCTFLQKCINENINPEYVKRIID